MGTLKSCIFRVFFRKSQFYVDLEPPRACGRHVAGMWQACGEPPVRGSRGGVGGEVNLSLVMCISSYVFIWSDLNALTTRVGGLVPMTSIVIVRVIVKV